VSGMGLAVGASAGAAGDYLKQRLVQTLAGGNGNQTDMPPILERTARLGVGTGINNSAGILARPTVPVPRLCRSTEYCKVGTSCLII
jgi:hypothetical protein